MTRILSALAWGLGAGVIAFAAGMGSITLDSNGARAQIAWIIAASVIALLFTAFKAHRDSQSERRQRDHNTTTAASLASVDGRLSAFDLDRIELGRVIFGKLCAMVAQVIVAVVKDPKLYEAKLDDALEALHRAIILSRRVGEERFRVALLRRPRTGTASS